MRNVRLLAHQTHHMILDFEQIFQSLKDLLANDQRLDEPTPRLHVLSELFLCGYPLQDLVLQKTFIVEFEAHMARIRNLFENQKPNPQVLFLMGGLEYQLDENGLPLSIENVIYAASPGTSLKNIYTKMLLPNYDIFDEKKYFQAGKNACLYEWQGVKLGLLICEDMWASTVHLEDPVQELANLCHKKQTSPDIIVNISASPYHTSKHQKRLARAKEISNHFDGCVFCYVNRVGAEDEILFDGQSFILEGTKLISSLPAFKAGHLDLTVTLKEKVSAIGPGKQKNNLDNTWESIYLPRLTKNQKELLGLAPNECGEIIEALQFGLQDYAKKCNMKHFVVALSGGMDSALVTAITKLVLLPGQTLEAIYMPGQYSATLSWDLSLELCKTLQIPLKSFNIKFLHGVYRNGFQEHFGNPLQNIADENIQSRIRGSILYARSNQTGAMVINTSNKSEIAVGYSTLYGDSVGAISMLGDLYKTEIYQLAEFLNSVHPNLIPQGIIDRAPSAELRENQKDQDSLPPYPVLDAILEGLISYRFSTSDLIKTGHKKTDVEHVFRLYQLAEYKRFQFCPIIKVRSKSFGFGHRVPIAKKILPVATATGGA